MEGEGGEGKRTQAEAVFQAIDHKRAKTRLAVNGRRLEPRCHVYARAHKS